MNKLRLFSESIENNVHWIIAGMLFAFIGAMLRGWL